jgi:hypothetical protein
MKTIVITAMFATLSLSACGKSAGPSNKSTAAAASTGNPAGGDPALPALPALNAQQADAIAKVISQLVSDLFNSLSGFPLGNFTTGQQSASTTLTCPLGGTAALSGAGNLAVTGTISTPAAALTGGSGSVTLTDCQIQVAGVTLKLNGTVSLMSVTGTGSATVSAQQAQFTTQGAGNTVGNLSVGLAGNTVSCAIATASTVNASGAFSFSNYVTSGTVSANTSGTVCSLPVNQPISFSF